MPDEDYERTRADPLWLDEEVPSGIFRAVVADREREQAPFSALSALTLAP